MDDLAKIAHQLHDKDFIYTWTSGFIDQHLVLHNGFSKEIIRELKDDKLTEEEIANYAHRPITVVLKQKLPVSYQPLELEEVNYMPETVTFYPISSTVIYAERDLRIHIYYEEK